MLKISSLYSSYLFLASFNFGSKSFIQTFFLFNKLISPDPFGYESKNN